MCITRETLFQQQQKHCYQSCCLETLLCNKFRCRSLLWWMIYCVQLWMWHEDNTVIILEGEIVWRSDFDTFLSWQISQWCDRLFINLLLIFIWEDGHTYIKLPMSREINQVQIMCKLIYLTDILYDSKSEQHKVPVA